MKFLVRLGLAGIFLYLMLKLGLLEMMMVMFIMVGKVVISIAKINPTAAAIGVLILIMMGGVNTIRNDQERRDR